MAVNFLQKKGYTILDRNFRKGYGEIDIVAIHNNILVFVEVKTRTSSQFGTPFEAITSWKIRPLVKTAQYYRLTHTRVPEQMRIDAIGIIIHGYGRGDTIEHIENIYGQES